MSIKVMSAVWDGPVGEPGDLLILLAIANHAGDDGFAHPSMQRIAHLARMTERGARKAIARLEDTGFLVRKVGAGPHGRNEYQVIADPSQGELFPPDTAPKTRLPGTQSSAPNPGTQSSARNSGQGGTQSSGGGGTNEFRVPRNPSSAKPSITSERESESSIDSDFDSWWEAYPRKESKGAARRAYKAARKKADAPTLLHSVLAYDQRLRAEGTDRRYTKLPATWLNSECWLDIAPPAREEHDGERPPVQSGADYMAGFAKLCGADL